MKPRLIIRSSSIHAAGCYTLTTLRKGEKICEYDGPRYSKEVADDRYKDRHVTYLFSCGERGYRDRRVRHCHVYQPLL